MQSELDSLQALVRRIGQGCSLEQFPLVDTESSRQLVSDALQVEIEDDVRLLCAAVTTAQDRAASVPAKTYDDLHHQYQLLQQRSGEYADRLGVAQDKSASALETALTALTSLTRHDSRS